MKAVPSGGLPERVSTVMSLETPNPWNQVAAGYSGWTQAHLARYAAEVVEMLDPDSKSAALDVACGSGAATLQLAPRVEQVVAVDFSPGMLAELRRKLREYSIDNVDVIEGDGQSMDFSAGSFDCAVSMFGLIFFPDRAAGLSELYRCLRHGGTAAVSCWPPAHDSPAMRWMVEGVRAAFPNMSPPPRSEAALDSPDKVAAEMGAAGFCGVEIHELRHDVMVHDIAGLWADMADGSAYLGMIRQGLSQDEWDDRQASAIQHLVDSYSPPFSVSMPAIVGIGRKP